MEQEVANKFAYLCSVKSAHYYVKQSTIFLHPRFSIIQQEWFSKVFDNSLTVGWYVKVFSCKFQSFFQKRLLIEGKLTKKSITPFVFFHWLKFNWILMAILVLPNITLLILSISVLAGLIVLHLVCFQSFLSGLSFLWSTNCHR